MTNTFTCIFQHACSVQPSVSHLQPTGCSILRLIFVTLSPKLTSELLLFAVIKYGVLLGDGAVENQSSGSYIGAGKPHPQAGTREDKTGTAACPVPSGDGVRATILLAVSCVLLS